MKRLRGSINVWAVVGVVIVALVGVAAYFVIDGNNKVSENSNSILGPSEKNGNIGDHIKGNPEAPVVIFEYADYQCPGCASINPRVNQAVEELDGKLAVVYRSFLLPYHQNGTAAASAAEAAGLQGYWKPYADKLFAKQTEWEELSPSDRTEKFNQYFLEVTEGKGDVEKFNRDIASEEVSKKISYDMRVGKNVNVEGTPAFYVDGQLIAWSKQGKVIVNGKTVSWDKSKSGEEFVGLLKEIVETKLAGQEE